MLEPLYPLLQFLNFILFKGARLEDIEPLGSFINHNHSRDCRYKLTGFILEIRLDFYSVKPVRSRARPHT